MAQKISGVEQSALSLSAELLADIREVFETKRVERISTADLITALCEDDEKTWATYNRGKTISPRQIAKRLGEYGIASKNVRIGCICKGFEREQFEDAFIRYLACTPSISATPLQPAGNLEKLVADSEMCSGTKNLSATDNILNNNICSGVADRTPLHADTYSYVEVEI